MSFKAHLFSLSATVVLMLFGRRAIKCRAKKKKKKSGEKNPCEGGKLNSDIQKSLSLLSGAIDSGIYHFTTQAKSYISRKPCIASLTKHSTDIRLIVFN